MDLLLINIYASLLSGLVVIGIGFFVFFKNPKGKLNIIFLLFCLAGAIWLLTTSIVYRSDTDVERIFWDRLVYVGVIFLPILMYHFGLVFTNTENKNKIKLYLGYLGTLIFLLLSRTNYFVDNLYKYNWGFYTQARIFHHFFLLFFSLYVILFLIEIYNFLKKNKDKLEKRSAEYLFLSFVIMNIGAYAYLPAYGININPIGAYGAEIIAFLILAFAILKYHLFEIRVILTEILVLVMGILLLVFSFLLSGGYRILGIGTFLLFCLFAYYLVKTTHQETERREKAEKIAAQERILRVETEKLAQREAEMRKKEIETREKAEKLAARERQLKEEIEKIALEQKKLAEVHQEVAEEKTRRMERIYHQLAQKELEVIELKKKISELEEELKRSKK